MPGKLVGSDNYEVCLYPQSLVRVTQSYAGGTSHKCVGRTNTGLWDINQQVGTRTPIYAPFSAKCVSIGAGNQCWLQSLDKVHYLNSSYKDTLGYLTFSFGHSNTLNIAVGETCKQGDIVGYTGNNSASAIHSHLILNIGHYSSPQSYLCTSVGLGSSIYYAPNPSDLDNFFYFNNTDKSNGSTFTMGDNSGLTLHFYHYQGGSTPVDPDPDPTPTDKWKVTLNVSPSGSGYTKGQGTYSNGERAYLYAYANQGWKFTKWSDGYTSSERYWDITSNLTLTAYFEELTYNITGSVQDDKGTANTGGSISGLGTYKYGTSHDIGITADKQYVIESIKVNGNEVLSDSEVSKITSYTYHIDSLNQDYNIIVTFRKKGILINGYGGIDFQIL